MKQLMVALALAMILALVVSATVMAQEPIPTPWWTVVYGEVLIDGAPAPVGTVVEVITPRGDVAGKWTLTKAGILAFTHVYGEDPGAKPPIPGFRSGEPLAFRVNGEMVGYEPEVLWYSGWSFHWITVGVRSDGESGTEEGEAYLIFLPAVIVQR